MVDWDREYLSTRGIGVKLPLRSGFGRTDRIDGWWKGPTAMAAYLGIMILYSTWRGMMEADFWIFENFGDDEVKLAVAVIWVSAIASALIDNIPFTAAMIPVIFSITEASGGELSPEPLLWALAMGCDE